MMKRKYWVGMVRKKEETLYFQKYRSIWLLIMFVTMVTDNQIVAQAV